MRFKKSFVNFLPLFLGGILILPFLYYLFKLFQYIPGFDETFQIEAGLRISRGLGNTYSWVLGKDLAEPNFTFQNAWPIGYSFILSTLLFIGLPLIIALKVLKTLVILSSIYFWIRFGNNFLNDIYSRIVFASLIAAHVILCSVSVTDMMIIMLVPVFSGLVFRLSHNEDFPNYDRLRVFVNPIAIGTIVALIILIKYSGLFLIFTGIGWICYSNYRLPRTGIVNILKFSIPICVILLAISIVNYFYTSNINSVTSKGVMLKTAFFYPNWLGDISNAVFNATHIGKILERSNLGGNINLQNLILSLKVLVFISFFLAFLFLVRSGSVKRLLAHWVVINYLAAAFFLKLVTVFYFSDTNDWTPVKEGRFYWALIPFLVLCILMAVQHLYSTLKSIAKSIVAVSFFGLMLLGITYYSNTKYRIYADLDYEIATLSLDVSNILRQEKSESVIFFGDPVNWQLYPNKGFDNFLVDPPVFSPGNYFSKNTTVVMICSCKEYTQLSLAGPTCVNSEFDQIAKNLKFNSQKSGKYTQLFWKVFPAGYTFK